MYEEHSADLVKALQQDLRKPQFEAYMYEVLLLKRDVKNTLGKLRSWAKPKALPRNLISLSDKMYYDHQPHGVVMEGNSRNGYTSHVAKFMFFVLFQVLILSPWNYPFNLALMPLAAAIAAGNCVLLKPSEVSSACSATLAALLPKYLDQEFYRVVQGEENANSMGVKSFPGKFGPFVLSHFLSFDSAGDALETQKLLREKFDFIFFTGSSQIGRLIYSQAAALLTPVCLELGGKS